MDNSQSNRAIVGRVKTSSQGDPSVTGNGKENYGHDGATDDHLEEALRRQCAIGKDNVSSAGCAGNATAGSWNIKASEFVPTGNPKAATSSAATACSEAIALADTSGEFNQNDATLCYELACALERLAKAPGSFSEESTNIISICDELVTNARQAQCAADSIVQFAIAYRSFTYDAANLCQQISTSMQRNFGQSRYTFRDFLLSSIEKEHKQLEAYVAAGTRDRQKGANSGEKNDSSASGEGMWSPYEYRTYVNGLSQFTGFVFMNVLDENGQRMAPLGRSVRSTLLTLLKAADTDYLDSVLIILKECGRPLAELYDANGEWVSIIDTLDQLLANSQPGASLLSDPKAPPPPEVPENGTPCLRISVPLRNQLRRFVDQARGWTRPSASTAAPAAASTASGVPIAATASAK